jgi:hypothetical protein
VGEHDNGWWEADSAPRRNSGGTGALDFRAFPAGDRIRPVSTGGGEQPTWAPDGKSLFFIAPQGLVSVAVSDAGVPTGRPAIAYDKPFGQSDPIARDYTIAPDGRPFIIEPSERRPGVTHLCVVTNWYQLLK